jgi:GNAT superfamily N-acetyltransferase
MKPKFRTEEICDKNKIVAVQHILILGDSEVGFINVNVLNKNNYITAVNIERRYRGKGYGKKLYEHALRAHGKLSTRYFNASNDSQRVWNSLVKKYIFKTDFFGNRLSVYNTTK